MEELPFDNLGAATKMRDVLTNLVKKIINTERPAPQYGTVVSVEKQGASWNVGDLMPPEGPGNPAQAWYASVAVDTGEIVSARIADVIPVARNASLYDPDNDSVE